MKHLLKVLGVISVLAIAAPVMGQIRFSIRIGPPPPPPREVIVAAPFAGAVWVPGYYAFDYAASQYRWVPGVWMRPPYPGAVWIAPHYLQRGRRYGYVEGFWQAPGHPRVYRRDRDGRGRAWGRGGGEGSRPIRAGRAPMGGD